MSPRRQAATARARRHDIEMTGHHARPVFEARGPFGRAPKPNDVNRKKIWEETQGQRRWREKVRAPTTTDRACDNTGQDS